VIGHGRVGGEGAVGADLAQPGAGDRLWAEALGRLDGRIDVLVNNAGVYEAVEVSAPGDAWRDGWSRTLQVNLQASADLCRSAVLHFGERAGPGRIVNIASRAAYRGDSPAHWHYAASKAGMVAMTKSIARAYADRGVLAFAVCPGYVRTEMAEADLAGPNGARVASRDTAGPRCRSRGGRRRRRVPGPGRARLDDRRGARLERRQLRTLSRNRTAYDALYKG
jgi:NAD(P)-dependent dehydrogenase (short-subunit alcohol dehydrogenase family)